MSASAETPAAGGDDRGRVRIHLGVKTDPVEYRYTFEWLFRILSDAGIRHVQLGTFFELYHLPDASFRSLRRQAEDLGLQISSVFTSHRELGGFFRGEPEWEAVARRGFERLIEVAGILGARSVGSNPGSVPRDRMGLKKAGVDCYLRNAKELLQRARAAGLSSLLLEPMSSLAEPPALPGEIRDMMEELVAHHRNHPADTCSPGLCFDVSHGYADRERNVRHSSLDLLDAALPWIHELHLKNTDPLYAGTFGFGEAERAAGAIDLPAFRDRLLAGSDCLPVRDLIAYLEIPGPKLGRDHTDPQLEAQLRSSIEHLRGVFEREAPESAGGAAPHEAVTIRGPRAEAPGLDGAPGHVPRDAESHRRVLIAPSIMCADSGHLEEEVRRLEAAGSDWLHFDIMDAHFVPNLPVGLVLLQDLRKLSALPFDVHLMVDRNDFFIDLLAPIGVQYVSVHVESSVHLDRTLERIRAMGAKAGAALNPATPLSSLDWVLDRLDFVLIMTVNPGYAGQKLVPAGIRKIHEAREYLRSRGSDIPIEVDGNVSLEHIPAMVAAGAGVLVAGTSSVFRRDGTRRQNFDATHASIRRGLEMEDEIQRRLKGGAP